MITQFNTFKYWFAREFIVLNANYLGRALGLLKSLLSHGEAILFSHVYFISIYYCN